MSYLYKKSLRFKAGKKEYQYSLGKDELPSFMGGMFGKSEEINGVQDFIDIVNGIEDAHNFSFFELPQEDLNLILKSINKKVITFKYVDIKSSQKTLDLRYLKLCKKLNSVDVQYCNKNVKLWNMRFNHKLEEVSITDCKRLLNQKGLIGCKASKVTTLPSCISFSFNILLPSPRVSHTLGITCLPAALIKLASVSI